MTKKKGDEQFTEAELSESEALLNTPPAPTPDEFAGMGGSYVVDPVTGARVREAFTREVRVKVDPKTHERIPDPED